MKSILLLISLFLSVSCFAQISVGPIHVGKSKKFDKGTLKKFKNTETIFVLSDVYNKEDYEKILEDTWNVTPYKIVQLDKFEIEDYLSDKYSIAQLGGFLKTTSMGSGSYTSLYTYVDFKIYDSVKIKEKLKKLSSKKREKRKADIIDDYSSDIARFYIFPKDDFIHTSISEGLGDTFNSMYKDEVFFNYKPGFLKNYFQKINGLIQDEVVYWMYEDDYLPELKELSTNILYVPSYMTIKYNGWTAQDSEADDENIDEIFKNYNHKYVIIDDQELNDKIMNNEKVFYLRYVRMNTERFLQIVNSKNGEIIYRNYIPGLSYKIKSKHLNELNKKIDKAHKK